MGCEDGSNGLNLFGLRQLGHIRNDGERWTKGRPVLAQHRYSHFIELLEQRLPILRIRRSPLCSFAAPGLQSPAQATSYPIYNRVRKAKQTAQSARACPATDRQRPPKRAPSRVIGDIGQNSAPLSSPTHKRRCSTPAATAPRSCLGPLALRGVGNFEIQRLGRVN